MPRNSSSAASQPDIEDLIKSEDSDAVAYNPKRFPTHHKAVRHDFQSPELLAIRTELLEWYDAHRRKLPWRGDPPPYLTTATHTSQKKSTEDVAAGKKRDLDEFMKAPSFNEARKVAPYETWVSEIMLQQTRVDTVVEYFLRWIDRFPTVAALAEANEDDVNALWAGLGYYRRARMLHAGAKYVMEKYEGELPSTVDQLLTIPGIGPYTAGAIASIAFGNREPLVDGNVIRVMARIRAVGADPKNKQLIKFSWKAASELVGECDRPGALNQALMELGATICTVQNPQCSDCPVKSVCLALEERNAVKLKCESSTFAKVSADECSICDYTRVMEWDRNLIEVTKYPLKAKKNDSKQEVICIAVVSAPAEDLTAPKRKAANSIDDTSPSDWKFLMSKRPKGGLLAGQWEFLHTKMSDGNTIPPYSKRKAFTDTRLMGLLENAALSRSSRSINERRDVGELTHIFSHVKHHMGIEHVHFKSKPQLVPGAKSEEMRWLTSAEMRQFGLTTGVKKILHLVLDPTKTRTSRVSPPMSTKSTKYAFSPT
ncbi:unnamed protein product [Peronospora destructor]|uniref:Adenine DNA glycosylase n=1 Tax=Peronospora destructor TaxID=86335 RepID=A0AAV0VDL3_9STRA|nr:unnamed protein product [Peronospora destructor]